MLGSIILGFLVTVVFLTTRFLLSNNKRNMLKNKCRIAEDSLLSAKAAGNHEMILQAQERLEKANLKMSSFHKKQERRNKIYNWYYNTWWLEFFGIIFLALLTTTILVLVHIGILPLNK